MVNQHIKIMWVLFTNLKNSVIRLIRVYLLWKIFLPCFSSILNITILNRTFTWSFKLLAGLFSTITLHLYIIYKWNN